MSDLDNNLENNLKNNLEIERKFLVKHIPDLSQIPNLQKNYIKQAYISTTPLLRIRQKNEQYFFTYKSRGTIQRTEVEEEITKEQFLNLWSKIEGYPIIKTRYTFPLVDIINKNKSCLFVELDIYEGEHEGFKNVEVEFSSLEEANSFIPPEWFGEDITENFLYTNASLSKNKV